MKQPKTSKQITAKIKALKKQIGGLEKAKKGIAKKKPTKKKKVVKRKAVKKKARKPAKRRVVKKKKKR